MTLIGLLMLIEWYNMTKSKYAYLIAGLPIVIMPILSLINLRQANYGEYAILIFFAMIWMVDIFAMLGGKKLGGAKLAPHISPKKTWSGLFCGMIACAAILLIFKYLLPHFPLQLSAPKLVLFGLVFGAAEQCSDLSISYFKRRFNIKDSGIIIPGHGGVLDRFDGIIITAPLFLWMIL
jgi:phosphatidate cytidylyltransferase